MNLLLLTFISPVQIFFAEEYQSSSFESMGTASFPSQAQDYYDGSLDPHSTWSRSQQCAGKWGLNGSYWNL